MIDWTQTAIAALQLQSACTEFVRSLDGSDWRIIWAAGAATPATEHGQAMAELIPIDALMSSMRERSIPGRGSFFLASSAGGVYAGSKNPPFGSSTAPPPLSAYGELKLAQERATTDALRGICPVTIGRFSNIYGPGQNLAKLQGLVSRLALAAATRRAINIFVPLDTIRDYVFVDDAALATLRWSEQAHCRDSAAGVKVIASGQPVTVGQLIRTVDQVTKRRVPVALGTHPSAAAQALDLRMEPTSKASDQTTLPAGIKAVYLDILERIQREPLSA